MSHFASTCATEVFSRLTRDLSADLKLDQTFLRQVGICKGGCEGEKASNRRRRAQQVVISENPGSLGNQDDYWDRWRRRQGLHRKSRSAVPMLCGCAPSQSKV